MGRPKKIKSDLVIAEKKDIEKVSEDVIKNYLNVSGLGAGLKDHEKDYFIQMAMTFQLNPFKREIYCIPYLKNVKNERGEWIKERAVSIITGYEIYLKRAERLGMLNGWGVRTEGSGNELRAIITIYRKDWQHPFIHEVLFKEYFQDNKMWKEKGVTMIRKVATAQGFRLAFPDEMGGLPYTADELPSIMTTIPAIEINEKPKHTTEEIKKLHNECSEKLSSAKDLLRLAQIAKEYQGIEFSQEEKEDLTNKYNIRKKEILDTKKED